jgi:hypothetical protein
MTKNWTLWSEQRPTDHAILYSWRVAPCMIGGLELTPEWTDKMSLHGMGYGDPEYWPHCSDWNGHTRSVPASLAWAAADSDEKEKQFKFHGLGLEPCRYCESELRIEWSGPWICAPIWKASQFSIRCSGCGLVKVEYFNDLKAVRAALNRKERKA